MKRFFYPAIIAIFIAGCGSDVTVSNVATNTASKNSVSNLQVNTAVALPSDQTNPIPPPTTINQSNVNAGNMPDANHILTEVSSVSRKNLDRLKSKGGSGDTNPAPIPAVAATPNAAPDNSELSSTMNAQGTPIETRVFKSNPTLAKIERTFADLENPVTKVYLKNGKVLTMPKGAVEKPETATADEILRAVGVKP